MSWISGLALYFIIWWTVLFAVLPFSLRTQDDEGDTVLGTVASAPRGAHLRRAAFRTTLVSLWCSAPFTSSPGSGIHGERPAEDRARNHLEVADGFRFCAASFRGRRAEPGIRAATVKDMRNGEQLHHRPHTGFRSGFAAPE